MGSKLNYFQTRPKAVPIDTRNYLSRIDVVRSQPNLEFLKTLHKSHLLHIPFENLDIHYHRRIDLEIRRLYEKIIVHKRGGFCYELNALFLHLLNNLGFDAHLGSARVYKDGNVLSPAFDHMVVFVMLPEGIFLCDVGFGSLFIEPKSLQKHQPVLDYTRYYLFDSDPDENWILKRSKDGNDYQSVYNFEIKSRELIEFIPKCNFHQESMDSDFKKKKMITQLTQNGRITLTDRKLKITQFGEIQEKEIMNEDEFFAALEQHFGFDSRELFRQQLE